MATVYGTSGVDWIDLTDGVTNLADTIYGYNGNDTIFGYAGDDTIYGGAGLDRLYGDTGSDVLKGGGGADRLDGGSGIDTASYAESAFGVRVSLKTNEAYDGDAAGDLLYSIENLVGSQYNDTLHGDNNTNVLNGLNGNDTLKGYGGADSIYGGNHHDWLYGIDGNDTLRGESGDDRLNGGMGVDTLYGGSGADAFWWTDATETGVTAATMDAIMDFNRPQGDVIDLANIDANVYAGGNQAFTFIGTAAFSGTPGEVRYYQSGGNTYLEMQTGTSVDVEGVIRLNGLHTPDASWFVL